jgi:hypothetical protein
MNARERVYVHAVGVRMRASECACARMRHLSMIACAFAHMHVCSYARLLICTFARMRVCVVPREYMFECMHDGLRARAFGGLRDCRRTRLHVHVYARIYALAHLSVYASMRVCVYVHMQAYMHACILRKWLWDFVRMNARARVYVHACRCANPRMSVCAHMRAGTHAYIVDA